MKNVTENNKLIAEFMGGLYNNQSMLSLQSNEIWLPYHGVCNYKSDNGKRLKYHSDWNWLMPVVEKIESLGNDILITSNYIQITYNKGEKFIAIELEGNIKIFAVYDACIEFIKWYNEQNKNK